MAKYNIDATLHRIGKNKTRITVWTRRYARIETAVRRCTEFIVLEGEVGDVIEFYLRLNGYQVATIRMTATGKLDVVWNDHKLLKRKQDLTKFEAEQIRKSSAEGDSATS